MNIRLCRLLPLSITSQYDVIQPTLRRVLRKVFADDTIGGDELDLNSIANSFATNDTNDYHKRCFCGPYRGLMERVECYSFKYTNFNDYVAIAQYR